MPGTLYVVATPIGNLADITHRALDTLRQVDLVAAEDTRVTRNLLQHYEIHTPMTAYHQHSLSRKAESLVELLKAGKSVALVSDAGTPGISDPGHEIITLAISNEIPIISIPGPSAIITALTVSGLPTRRFLFEGFPPRRNAERVSYFQSLGTEQRTMVFYESPNRLLHTLKAMLEAWGDREVAVVREATKMFEEVRRGALTSLIEWLNGTHPKGEITLVVAGAVTHTEVSVAEIQAALRKALSAGKSDRDAVRDVAAVYPVPRKEVYGIMLDMKKL